VNQEDCCPFSLPPGPDPETGRQALRSLLTERNLMSTLQLFHRRLGDVFRITLPGFHPIMVAGPQANRFVLVRARERLSWRPEGDPVTKLLRHGLLVEDGESHDRLRNLMNPALHKKQVAGYVEKMWRYTDQVSRRWSELGPYNMLDEMRRVALLIFMDTLFAVDFSDDLPRLWQPILKIIKYISPGPWLLWRNAPRPGYAKAISIMDDYLYGIIATRRRNPTGGNDLLSALISGGDLGDDLIRDQLLTMLIAGHDTGTALMAWSLYLLGRHPQALRRARQEVDAVLESKPPDYEALQKLDHLDRVVKESLRLYPPIHVGTRRALEELTHDGYRLPRDERVLYSIYLTHRDPKQWADPDDFDPDRFIAQRGQRTHEPYAYVPFGGGPRNCIGAVFGQVEAQAVLARLIQTHNLLLVSDHVKPSMGATLEPHPGVWMTVSPRHSADRK
jgi:cytochrome P450